MKALDKRKHFSKEEIGKFQQMLLREILPGMKPRHVVELLFELWGKEGVESFCRYILFQIELKRESDWGIG